MQLQNDVSLARRAAWLSYIGGYRQEDIAGLLGVSRVKVTRLIGLAHREGLIRVFVEGSVGECMALEDQLKERYGLGFCAVAPDLGEPGLPLRTLASAGARFLLNQFEAGRVSLVGIGHGRTLAAVVDALPNLALEGLRFVSLLGGLTRNAAAYPFDVIHSLARKTGGQSYFMPVPFFANSVEDRAVLLAQTSVRDVLALAHEAGLYVVGIGEVGPEAHMLQGGMITASELAEVNDAGAVGEILGQFLDAGGRPVATSLNGRALSLGLEDLKGKSVVAIAGGEAKIAAIAAVLRSGVLTGLVTDERTATRLVANGRDAAPPAAGPRAKTQGTIETKKTLKGGSHARKSQGPGKRARSRPD